jgi:hypothetical protein
MTTIVAFAGKRGSGKSEASKVLVEEFGFEDRKFADPLKNMMRAFYWTCGMDTDEIERKIEGDLKEEPCEFLAGKTPRYAMQMLGTEWRNLIAKTLWSDIFKMRAQTGQFGDRVVCSDLRFDHEAEALDELAAYTVLIYRPEADQVSDEYAQHVSESGIKNLKVASTIVNDDTLEYLHAQTRAIAAYQLGMSAA